MPAPLDLTGQTFGRLTVLGCGARVKFGRWQQGWICRCACGAELTVPQDRLPHQDWIARGRVVTACTACRGQPCVVCGANIPLDGTAHAAPVTCSPACADQHRKARQRRHWVQRCAVNPDLPKQMHQRRQEKAATDPAYAERVAAWERQRGERRKQRAAAEPEYAQRLRNKNRQCYVRHAERIQAERRVRLDALSPAERQQWCEQARVYCRNWRRRQRAAQQADPKAYERFREIYNEYKRRWHAERFGPPPERICVICGTVFASRRFRVLCGNPKCLTLYHRDAQVRARTRATARAALGVFLTIERELNARLENLRGEESLVPPGSCSCPDRR